MMLRQSSIKWIGLVGIMMFLAGLLVNVFTGKKATLHLILGMPVSQTRPSIQEQGNPQQEMKLGFTVQLDSLQTASFLPVYELQIREMDQQETEDFHTNVNPPSFLLASYPLIPMKIRKIGKIEYRCRLAEFYPDFTFTYTYPQNQDTIPPRAPGITLNLIHPGTEEVVTLRSGTNNQNRLEDFAHLGDTA